MSTLAIVGLCFGCAVVGAVVGVFAVCLAIAGMTLRDYFAAQALAGYCANPEFDEGFAQTAHLAYTQADAMIAERDR